MKYTAIITFAAMLLAACNQTPSAVDQANNESDKEAGREATTSQNAQPEKNIIRKHLSIPREFDHLINLGSVDIVYTQGSYSIDVEGDSAMLRHLKTIFDSNLLTVSIETDGKSTFNFYGNTSNVKMYISAPQLNCVSICGNGGFESQATWRGEDLQAGVLGTGSMKLATVECTTFNLQSKDVGNVHIAHLKAEDAGLMSFSSAQIEADVQVNNLTIMNSGKQIFRLTGSANNVFVQKPDDPNLHLDVTTPPVR